MVAAKNCFGFQNYTYGGMLGLGLNADFDEKNLFVWQLNKAGIINNATFGIQLNQAPLGSYLTLGQINTTVVSSLMWYSVNDTQAEMWLWPLDSIAVNNSFVNINASYTSFDSQSRYI